MRPVSFIPIETKVSIIQGMGGLSGFGSASIVVSTFSRSQRAAMNLGYSDDINTGIGISGNVRHETLWYQTKPFSI